MTGIYKLAVAYPVESFETILGVWAHPDDETYLSGGVMAFAARLGRRVVCITATRGEEGSQDHVRWPPAGLGAVREAELEAALSILGVREHHWLDYHDGQCAQADPAEAIARIGAIMEEVHPDAVLTFGPDGMTGHPDHITVSSWTTEAFRRAADPKARLFYTTTTQEIYDLIVPVLAPHNVFAPGTPPVTPREDLGIEHMLDEGQLDLKLQALRAQVSQTEDLLAAVGEDFFRISNRLETFVEAQPEFPLQA